MRVTWLPETLRAAGLQVEEVDGWRGRGQELVRVDAVVCHATITGNHVPDRNVAGILVHGRPDLTGPLAQLGLDRSGRWWMVADGRCNHNGYGTYGNRTIGIEAFNDGVEPWSAIQVDAWQLGVAAICSHANLPVSRVLAHRETDPKRKQDPKGIDMDAFRAAVEHDMHQPVAAGKALRWLI